MDICHCVGQYSKNVRFSVDNALMNDILSCKFFLTESGRCQHSALEDSDYCSWHSGKFWDTDYIDQLTDLRYKVKGLNLRGISLQNLQTIQADFQWAKLHLLQLNACGFSESVFDRVHFEEAYLGNCVFENTSFQNSIWESSEINAGEFTGIDFGDSRFRSTILNSIRLKNCSFSKVRFDRCVLEMLDFGACLWVCDDSYHLNIFPKFHRTKLKNCLFSNADLAFFHFERCEFLNCHFLDVDMQRTNFQQCIFVDTQFGGISNIAKAYFDECTFNVVSQKSLSLANPDLQFSV